MLAAMNGQGQADESVPFVARRSAQHLSVGACSVLGVLAAMVSIGEALSRPDPPSNDLVALWLLAEIAAALVSVPLLALVLARRSPGAGLLLCILAPLSAAMPAAVVTVVPGVAQAPIEPGLRWLR